MKQRQKFLREYETGEWTMTELCRAYEISRPTGYELWHRYRNEGTAGLEERSRAPARHPNQTPPAIEEQEQALQQGLGAGRELARQVQVGDHVGVDDDHVVKSTARGGADRDGRSMSMPPSSPKRARSVPRRLSSSPGSRTASTRMLRISASIDRPWAAALTRNRSRTLSSKFRMLTAANTTTSASNASMA